MIANITNVTRNDRDFQWPQLDIQVEYSDKRFPNGKRLFIFTLPSEKFKGMDSESLERMIKQQGRAFDEVLANGEELIHRESVLKNFIGQKFDI